MGKSNSMDGKNVAPTGQGPASANEIGKHKDNDIMEISDESVIIYRSWFECLKEQGTKRFAQAMIALLSFAFYDTSVRSFNLSRQLEAILETFTPVIETNRKRRKGGSKGADFGKKGGRPSHNVVSKSPKGLSDRTPMVPDEESPMASPYTVTDNVTVNVNETVSVNVTDEDMSSPHTDCDFFIPIFFFRNARSPKHQAKKFVEHYAPSDWKLPGGEYMATDKQRIALAQRWEIRDDTTDRFKSEDLAMWRELYEIAPDDIKPLMVVSSIQFQRTEKDAIVAGPKAVFNWIEKDLENTKPIVLKWKGNRTYRYVPKD